MRRCIVQRAVFARLAALVAAGLSCAPPELAAQAMTAYAIVFPSVGLADGQRLRVTLFNPLGTPLRARAQIHHSGGVLVALGDGSVRSNAFASFDFDREDLAADGEVGTRRLQLRASLQIGVVEEARTLDGFAVSMDVIEISDGTSNTVFFSEQVPVPSHGGADDVSGDDVDDILTGIVPGQTLRVTVLAAPAFASERVSQLEAVTRRDPDPVSGHIRIFDSSGNVIGRSEELVIPQGQFRSFEIGRSALPVAGEPGTGRAQIRLQPFFPFSAKRLQRVLISYEIVDDAGRTRVLSGQECLVFFLGGTPGR